MDQTWDLDKKSDQPRELVTDVTVDAPIWRKKRVALKIKRKEASWSLVKKKPMR